MSAGSITGKINISELTDRASASIRHSSHQFRHGRQFFPHALELTGMVPCHHSASYLDPKNQPEISITSCAARRPSLDIGVLQSASGNRPCWQTCSHLCPTLNRRRSSVDLQDTDSSNLHWSLTLRSECSLSKVSVRDGLWRGWTCLVRLSFFRAVSRMSTRAGPEL